jgi:hypothetical protein
LLTMITCCCAFQETEMHRLTDHHSLITYHSLRIGRLAQW